MSPARSPTTRSSLTVRNAAHRVQPADSRGKTPRTSFGSGLQRSIDSYERPKLRGSARATSARATSSPGFGSPALRRFAGRSSRAVLERPYRSGSTRRWSPAVSFAASRSRRRASSQASAPTGQRSSAASIADRPLTRDERMPPICPSRGSAPAAHLGLLSLDATVRTVSPYSRQRMRRRGVDRLLHRHEAGRHRRSSGDRSPRLDRRQLVRSSASGGSSQVVRE